MKRDRERVQNGEEQNNGPRAPSNDPCQSPVKAPRPQNARTTPAQPPAQPSCTTLAQPPLVFGILSAMPQAWWTRDAVGHPGAVSQWPASQLFMQPRASRPTSQSAAWQQPAARQQQEEQDYEREGSRKVRIMSEKGQEK